MMNFFQKLKGEKGPSVDFFGRGYARSSYLRVQIQTSISQWEVHVNLISFCSFCSKLPDRLESTEEILLWVKAEPKRTLLTIG